MSFLLASAARATVGARSGQEDAFRLWPAEGVVQPKATDDGLLAVLADGMGGHAGGAVAGQTACATFTEVFAATSTPYEERLNTALWASNDALAKGVEQNAALRGMGCTLVAAWIDGTGVRWTSVGDSLLLLYRFPDVIRLNADHSLGFYLDEQARQHRISVGEARAAPNRNALRSALTGSKIDLIDVRGEPLELRPGDWVLLASDGIASLAGDELADVIYRYRQSTPDEMAEALVGAVAQKGIPDQDNTTVVAVRIDSDQQADDGLVTTRILRPGANGAPPPAGTGRNARAARPPTLVSSALEVSPAIWLGAAAGLLLVAIVLAVRMLPLSAPPPPVPAPANTGPQWPAPSFQQERPPEGATPPPETPIRQGPAPQFVPTKPRGEADRSGPRPLAPKEAPPLPAAPAPGIPARPQMEAPDPMPKAKKEAEPTAR